MLDNSGPKDLLARSRALREEIEPTHRRSFHEWERRRRGLGGWFQRQQRRYADHRARSP